MKYPITPEYIESLPEELALLYRDLETFILNDICERFKSSGELTNTAIEQLRLLQKRGYSLTKIKAYLKKTLGLSNREARRILKNAIERNQSYFTGVLTELGLVRTTFEKEKLDTEIAAIASQTLGAMTNLAQSLGFMMQNGRGEMEFTPLADVYQRVLDKAIMRVWSGAQDYNSAMRDAVKELADSGIQTVDYATGYSSRLEVAVRRAVMTGVSQISSRYTQELAADLGTPYYEISAHVGARDKPGKNPWCDHKSWQGRVYSTRDGDKYPNIYRVCGWGEVDGLEGANCRHRAFPFIDGVSERTYTDEQLANIDPEPFTFQGREYTAYEATQKQRQCEATMRKLRREEAAYRAAGLKTEAQLVKARRRRIMEQYRQFSEAAGLPVQLERINNVGYNQTRKPAPASPIFVNTADDLFKNARDITPIEGYEDIVSHGDKIGFVFKDKNGAESDVSVKEFADIIRLSESYHGGNIRLIACEAGADGAIVAQGLSDELGVDILAPSDVIWVYLDGEMRIGQDPQNPDGEWRLFKPRR